MAWRVVPAVTVTAVAAGAGIVALRQQKEERGRHDEIVRAMTCDATAHRATSSSFKEAFKKLQLDRDQFRAAASHLYPIEKLVEQWASGTVSGDDVKHLCGKWARAAKDAGSLRAKFGKRLSHNAQGVDIGSPVEPYFEHAVADPALRSAVGDALTTYGACYLKNALTPDAIANIRARLLIQPNTRFKPARDVGARLVDADPNVTTNRYTLGRLHCLLRGSLFEGLACLEPSILPFVYDFFDKSPTPDEGSQLAMSEMQLILSEPMAWEQAWHRDNGHRGITFLIPLERIENQGYQMVFPGTHLSQRESWDVLMQAEGPVTHPGVWEAGDVWILDSRLMHRGLENNSAYETIPMLVVRFDHTSTMPPGQRVWESRWTVHKGRMLERLFSFL